MSSTVVMRRCIQLNTKHYITSTPHLVELDGDGGGERPLLVPKPGGAECLHSINPYSRFDISRTWLKLMATAVASARSLFPNQVALSCGGKH
eukprot:783756-Prorocentrum_minimum.AAC.1